MTLEPGILRGNSIRLEPLGYQHTSDLLAAAVYDEIWLYLDEPTPRTLADMEKFIHDALSDQAAGIRAPFAIVRTSTGRAVGSTSYLDIRPADRTLEIGWTWLTPHEWGTGVNTETKYLLMRYAFREWHAGRVAIKTDLRNLRSQKAIERLGAKHEGVLRNHRLLSTGEYRHTTYYSVIDSEWQDVCKRLEHQIHGE